MTTEDRIAELKKNIKQGEEFLKMGYDCEMMMSITRVLLAKLEGESPCMDCDPEDSDQCAVCSESEVKS